MRTLPVLAILSILWLGGCGGSGAEDGPADPRAGTGQASRQSAPPAPETMDAADVTDIPNGPWTDLARRLVASETLEAAMDITRDILARGGVSTFDGERVLVEARAPAASFQAVPIETLHLAMEARRRAHASRLTAAEVAQMLETFGWPFPGGRPDGGDASRHPRGRAAEPDAIGEAERAAQEAEAAADAVDAEVEAERQAGRARVEAAQQRVRDVTGAYQRARLAAVRAPAGGKAAADAQLAAATAARKTAIDELGAVRRAESEAERERRTRASRAREAASRLEDIQDRIGPDFAAGERLMEMLAAWVRSAAEQPDDPRSFTPLFLAEMARLQDPPVDLLGSRYTRPGRGDGPPVDLRGGPRSAQLRLTLLELELIAAAFHRPPAGSAHLGTGGRLTDRGGLRLASFAPPVQDPCSSLKSTMGGLGEVAGAGASEAAGWALERAVQGATDAGVADAFGKAMSAVGIAGKIAKLVAFYADEQVTVTADPRRVHKQTAGEQFVVYKATAGVSDEDWAEYQRLTRGVSTIERAARDCLDAVGMPTLPEISDLVKDAENWLVEWKLLEGSPPHAQYSTRSNEFYLPGRGAMKLYWRGEHSATAPFVVHIMPESKHTGTVVRAYVTARASVDAAGMPSLGTFINPLKGVLGLIDALVDLGAGWFQYMNQPTAYAAVEVEYHCPTPTTLHPPAGSEPVADGGGGDGPDDCLIAAGSKQ